MIICKVLLLIFLFVKSEAAEKVDDPCSKFTDYDNYTLVKCPSEKPEDDYLQCYDLKFKEVWEQTGSDQFSIQKQEPSLISLVRASRIFSKAKTLKKN